MPPGEASTMEEPEARPEAIAKGHSEPNPAFARAVFLATAALAGWAWVFADRPLFPSLLASVLLVYFPVMSLVTPTDNIELGPDKTRFYVLTAVVLLALGGLGALGLVELRPLPQPYAGILGGIEWVELLVQTSVLLGACLLLMGLFHLLGGALGWEERPLVRRLMPRSRREKRTYGLLCGAAGVGEEIAYRGFLPIYLLPWAATYMTAALAPCVAFGCLHMYQGGHGVLRTGLIGLLLAAGVYATGNIWAAVAAHTLLNLLVGLVLKDVLLGTPRPSPGEPPPVDMNEPYADQDAK